MLRNVSRHALVFLALLVLGFLGCNRTDDKQKASPSGGGKEADQPADNDGRQPNYPIPADVVNAWEKAGALQGWLRWKVTRPISATQFKIGYDFIELSKGGQAGDVPGFQLTSFEPGRLPRLPSPPVGFGLNAHATLGIGEVTDTMLKELAAFKHLQVLGLGGTRVTDVGVKELAALQQLQVLGLSFTKVTDAGLKELTGLKQLQRLDLDGTKVTDAGVAELQKALPTLRINR